MNDMDQIPLNTLIPDIYGEGFFNGKYYYVFNDTLFYLDIRIRHTSDDQYPMWCKVFHFDEHNECYRFDMEDRIKKYLKVNLESLIQASIDVVNYEGEDFYNELMKIKGSRENISIEEWNNLHVESFTKKQENTEGLWTVWDWKEVAQNGCKTERRRRLTETCPICGTRLIEVFVSSPAEMWEHLAGQEGMLTFCPHCQKQIRFHLECMN